MVKKIELSAIREHCAVCIYNCVIIFGGLGTCCAVVSSRKILVYNLYTERWERYVVPKTGSAPKPFHGAVSAAIEGTIFAFGGLDSEDFSARNALWKLSRAERGCFTWSFIKYESKKKSPSPRHAHTGWEYAGKLWIFGGEGPSPLDYLNDHGDIVVDPCGFARNNQLNNQLLCYDPNSQLWTNPQYFGTMPSPRSGQSSAITRENVWLFGGFDERGSLDDFFQLNMHSFTCTQIQTGEPSPQARRMCTLTRITDNQLVLHGGLTVDPDVRTLNDTWIIDITSYSWRPYTSSIDRVRNDHAATLGLNSHVIIIGGYKDICDTDDVYYDNIFHVMLEPKSLQKLALHTVYKNQPELPWKGLPNKLISLLGKSYKAQASGDVFSKSRSVTNCSKRSCNPIK